MSDPLLPPPDAGAWPGRPRRLPPWSWALLVLIALLIAAGVWQALRASPASSSAAATRGELAIDFQLPGLDGRAVRLSDLRGQVVLLNFWATWCPTCRDEMPDLNSLYHEYGASRAFVVVGVNLEETQDAVSAFAEQHDITFPLLRDAEGRVSTIRYRVRSLPASLIIDREGRIRDQWTGQLSRATMLQRLARVW